MTVRPHIAILVANLPAERDRRVIRECLSLEANGYDVTVIAPRGEPGLRVLPGSRNTRAQPYPVFVYGSGVLSYAFEFAWSFACIAVRLDRRGRPRSGPRGAGVQPAGRVLAIGVAAPGDRAALGVRPPRPVPGGVRHAKQRQPEPVGLPDPDRVRVAHHADRDRSHRHQ